MTRYEIDIAPEATREIEAIYLYIAEDSPVHAARWYFELHGKIQSLGEMPGRCPLAYENLFYTYELRNLIFGKYRVIFRVQEKTVQILHVKHGAQEPKPF